MERKKPRVNFDIGGKLPPQFLEAEVAILGVLLIEKDSFEKVSDILNPNCFYKNEHQIIYKAILDLHAEKKNVDILTITAQLKKLGELDAVGGPFFITQLTDKVVSSAHIEDHARLIAEAYLSREVIRISSEFQNRAFDDTEDIFSLIDEFHKEVDAIRNYGVDSGEVPLNVSLKEVVEQKKKDVASGVKLTGITTGHPILDNTTSGFNKGQMIVLGATSGEGKSARGLNFAKVAGENGHRVAYFSLEMSTRQLVSRMLIEESMVHSNDFRNNKLSHYDMDKLDLALKSLSRLPIHIIAKAGVNCKYILKKCKELIKRHGRIDMIVVDYIQIMTTDEKQSSREVAVASISRGLKQLAMDLDVPVIVLSQLNKDYATDKKNARRPTLSNLRESQAIGNDADLVLFTYRPSVHFDYINEEGKGGHPDLRYSPDNISEQEYLCASELIIGKNREGELGIIYEYYIGKHVKFQNEPPSFIQSVQQEISNNDIKPPFNDIPLPF